MANSYTSLTGTTPNGQWSTLAAAAYDRAVEYVLRDIPQWRNTIDKRPVAQAMPGTSVILTILKEFATLATTPLSELVTPDSQAPPAPNQVTVTLNEYGNYALQTALLQELAFTNPSVELANLIGKNLVDTIDTLIRNVADTATNKIWVNSGAVTTGGTDNLTLAGDVMSSTLVARTVGLLERRKTLPQDGVAYLSVTHPDVLADVMLDTSATAWTLPHNYRDTQGVYAGEVGTFRGARFLRTTRTTHGANTATTPVNIYSTYFFGSEALVEATVTEPHIVIGEITDPLRRYFPIGWRSVQGWSIYRQEALQIARTASGSGAL